MGLRQSHQQASHQTLRSHSRVCFKPEQSLWLTGCEISGNGAARPTTARMNVTVRAMIVTWDLQAVCITQLEELQASSVFPARTINMAATITRRAHSAPPHPREEARVTQAEPRVRARRGQARPKKQLSTKDGTRTLISCSMAQIPRSLPICMAMASTPPRLRESGPTRRYIRWSRRSRWP